MLRHFRGQLATFCHVNCSRFSSAYLGLKSTVNCFIRLWQITHIICDYLIKKKKARFPYLNKYAYILGRWQLISDGTLCNCYITENLMRKFIDDILVYLKYSVGTNHDALIELPDVIFWNWIGIGLVWCFVATKKFQISSTLKRPRSNWLMLFLFDNI